jgi:hypothetical protein
VTSPRFHTVTTLTAAHSGRTRDRGQGLLRTNLSMVRVNDAWLVFTDLAGREMSAGAQPSRPMSCWKARWRLSSQGAVP